MNQYLCVLMALVTLTAISALGSEKMSGVWVGGFSCINGQVGARITVTKPRKATLEFFELEGGAPMPDGSISLNLSYRTRGEIRLRQNRWIKQPDGWRAKRDRPVSWKYTFRFDGRAIKTAL